MPEFRVELALATLQLALKLLETALNSIVYYLQFPLIQDFLDVDVVIRLDDRCKHNKGSKQTSET